MQQTHPPPPSQSFPYQLLSLDGLREKGRTPRSLSTFLTRQFGTCRKRHHREEAVKAGLFLEICVADISTFRTGVGSPEPLLPTTSFRGTPDAKTCGVVSPTPPYSFHQQTRFAICLTQNDSSDGPLSCVLVAHFPIGGWGFPTKFKSSPFSGRHRQPSLLYQQPRSANPHHAKRVVEENFLLRSIGCANIGMSVFWRALNPTAPPPSLSPLSFSSFAIRVSTTRLFKRVASGFLSHVLISENYHFIFIPNLRLQYLRQSKLIAEQYPSQI